MTSDSNKQIIFTLRILPNSSKNEIIKSEGVIKVKITSPPVDGKANKALIEYLSKSFKIPKTSFKIIKGETSKDKTLMVSVTDEEKLQNLRNFLK